jgi:hypothetical protein
MLTLIKPAKGSPQFWFPSPSGDSLHAHDHAYCEDRFVSECFHRPQAILFMLTLSSRGHQKSTTCDTIFAYLDFSTAPCSSQNNEVLENIVLTPHLPYNPRSILFLLGETPFFALAPATGAVMHVKATTDDSPIMLIVISLPISLALKMTGVFYQALDTFDVIHSAAWHAPSITLTADHSRG